MARQEFPIGASQSTDPNLLSWFGNVLGESIPSEFLPTGTTDTYYSAYFELSAYGGSNVIFRVSDSPTDESGALEGQELSTVLEDSASAFTVEAGGLSITLSGPNHSSNQFDDNLEPYHWRTSTAKATELNTFIASYNSLSQSEKDATTLTLDDEQSLIQEFSLSTKSGNAEASIVFQARAAKEFSLTAESEASEASIVFSKSTIHNFSLSAESGEAKASIVFEKSTIHNMILSAESEGGEASLTMQILTARSLVLSAESGSAEASVSFEVRAPTEQEIISQRNVGSIRGIKTQAFPQPPQIDETLLNAQNREELVEAVQAIIRWIEKLPIYDEELKENISRSFLSTGSFITGLEVGDLTADIFRGEDVYIGTSNQFYVSGATGKLILTDAQNPPVRRLELGLFGAGAASGLKVWDSNGDLIFDLTGITADFSIDDGSITTDQLANAAVTADKLADSAVVLGKIAPDSVTENELEDLAVVTSKLAAGAITSIKIADNAIIAPLIAANTILAGNIASNAIITRHIATDSIVAAQIQVGVIPENFSDLSGEITDDQVADGIPRNFSDMEGLIGSADIAAGVIIASKIGAGAILSDKIAANAIIASKIAAGTITANKLDADVINTRPLFINTVSLSTTASGNTLQTRTATVNATNLSISGFYQYLLKIDIPSSFITFGLNIQNNLFSGFLELPNAITSSYEKIFEAKQANLFDPDTSTVILELFWKQSGTQIDFKVETRRTQTTRILLGLVRTLPGYINSSIATEPVGPVDPTDSMPSLTNPGTQNWTNGDSESVTVSVSGGDTPLNYTWTESIPGVSGSGLVLSGTPTTNGTYTATLEVEDDDGDEDSVSFSVVVSDTVTPPPPTGDEPDEPTGVSITFTSQETVFGTIVGFPTLNWNSVSDADDYDYNLNDTVTPGNSISGTTTNTSIAIGTKRPIDFNFTGSVRASNEDGESDYVSVSVN